jgi:hypothetical protein
MLIAYVDESGHSSDPRCQFVGLGGLVARSDDWDNFQIAWQGALDEFIGGKPFHMRDFAYQHEGGMYGSWKESKRRAFFGRLVSAITDNGARASGCVVSLEHFELLDREHQAAFRDPYFMAFQEVTKGLSLAAIPKEFPYVPESVAMVYSRQESFGVTERGRAQKLWHLIQKESAWGQWMGSYTTSQPSDLLPLQAADLFAYELTKEFENWVNRPKDPMRWALKQIIKHEPGVLLIKFFNHAVMLQTLVESGAITFQGYAAVDLILASHGGMKDVRKILRNRASES